MTATDKLADLLAARPDVADIGPAAWLNRAWVSAA